MKDWADQSEIFREAKRREDKARGGFWYWLMGESFSLSSLLGLIFMLSVTVGMTYWFFVELTN